jgi:hypothetical protein
MTEKPSRQLNEGQLAFMLEHHEAIERWQNVCMDEAEVAILMGI